MSSKDLSIFMYDEEEAFNQHMDVLSSLVRVNERDHSVIVIPEDDKITAVEKITLYLVGRYIRFKLKYDNSPDASNEEISQDLRIPSEVVNARMKDLRDSKLAYPASKGRHRISFVKIDRFLKKIRQKLGEHDDK